MVQGNLPRRRYLLACTAAVVAGCNSTIAESDPEPTDWPSFHADASNAGKTTAPVPAESESPAWRQSLEFPCSSPVVVDETVLVGDATGLVAFDAASGSLEWRTRLDGAPAGTPGVGDGVVFVPRDGRYSDLDNPFVQALEPQSGDELWRVDVDAERLFAPTVADETGYLCTSDGIYAIGFDGEIRWTQSVQVSQGSFDVAYDDLLMDVAPAVDDGRVFAPEPNGIAAIDADSGDVVWTESADTVRAAPAVSGDRVLLADVSNGIRSLDRTDGTERWHWEADGCWTTPAVSGGTVYATAGADIAAVSPSDGTERWRLGGHGLRGDCYSSPAVGSDGVVAGSITHSVAVLREGSVDWKYDDVGSRLSPALASGRIHAVTDDPALLTFD